MSFARFSSRLSLVLFLAAAAGCGSPMQFRWPDKAIWPGQTRVLGARGGVADLRIRCLGPGDLTLVDASSVSHTLAPNDVFSVQLADAEINLVNASDGWPTAVSVECEVGAPVQLRFEEVGGGEAVPSRMDLDGKATLWHGETIVLSVEGDAAITVVANAEKTPVRLDPIDPIDPDRHLQLGGEHVFRGAVRLRLSVQAGLPSDLSLSIRNADAWSLTR